MSGKHWSSAAWLPRAMRRLFRLMSQAAPIKGMKIASSETSITARLDNLRWSGLSHPRRAFALGITWILDGLEVTLAGALSGAFEESSTLHFTNFDVGFSQRLSRRRRARRARIRLAHRPDRAQEKLFFITLRSISTATAATRCPGSW